MNYQKLLFLLLFSFILSTSARAQTVRQGAFMIGGNLDFSSDKPENQDKATTYFTIAPNIGFYVIDDLGVGVNLNYTYQSINGNSSSTTSLAPFVRYYVFNPIFIEGQIGFGLGKDKGSFIGANIGYSWFLSSNTALEPMISYIRTNAKGDGVDRSSFGYSVGFQLFIGRL